MVQSTGISTRLGALALVGIGFVGLTFLGLRKKEEPVEPPGGGDPPVECAPGFHEENGVCVSDNIPPPGGCDEGFHEENGVCVPNDPETFPVIDAFTQSTDRVQSPGIVGFTVKPRKSRSTIRWSFGDGSNDVVNAVVVNHEYFPIGEFSGFVEVVEEDGRTETINFFVSVSAPDVPPGGNDIISNFNQTKGGIINGEAVGFSIALGVQVAQVRWNFGDGTPEVFNQISVDHIYNQVGTFNGFVEAIATLGGSETVPFTVRVEESPLNVITLSILIGAAAGSTIEPGENVDFAAQVGGGVQPFTSFNWKFGDGQVDRGDNRFPNHIYDLAGSYTVELEVTDSIGNKQQATKLISVKSKPPQFGDVTVTIFKDPPGAFDFLMEYRNNRQDIPISGSSIIRVFDGSKQIHSRVNGFQIPPLGKSTNGLDIRDEWPRETNLVLFVEYNDVNGKLLDDAQITFFIPDDVLPVICDPGFHEENGICVKDQIDPINCNPGFHEENGVCVKDDEPDDGLKLETKDFKIENFNVNVQRFSSNEVLTLAFSLPGNTEDIQFARVFVSARMDYETFASMKIVFNGQTLDTIQYGLGEQNATRDRDIVVTNLVKKTGLNDLVLVFESSNIFSDAKAFVNLASVFVQSLAPV